MEIEEAKKQLTSSIENYMSKDREAIKTLLTSFEQQTNELECLRKGELFTANQAKEIENVLQKYYIHKDVVKHEIERINSNYNKRDVPGYELNTIIVDGIIATLIGLIEERDK